MGRGISVCLLYRGFGADEPAYPRSRSRKYKESQGLVIITMGLLTETDGSESSLSLLLMLPSS